MSEPQPRVLLWVQPYMHSGFNTWSANTHSVVWVCFGYVGTKYVNYDLFSKPPYVKCISWYNVDIPTSGLYFLVTIFLWIDYSSDINMFSINDLSGESAWRVDRARTKDILTLPVVSDGDHCRTFTSSAVESPVQDLLCLTVARNAQDSTILAVDQSRDLNNCRSFNAVDRVTAGLAGDALDARATASAGVSAGIIFPQCITRDPSTHILAAVECA